MYISFESASSSPLAGLPRRSLWGNPLSQKNPLVMPLSLARKKRTVVISLAVVSPSYHLLFVSTVAHNVCMNADMYSNLFL